MSAELGSFGALLKFSVLIGGLLVLGLAQARWPRRQMRFDAWRWLRHLSLIGVSTLLLRLLIPLAAALLLATQSWGLLRQIPQMPLAAELVLSVLLLDLAIYFQHRAFHHFPWLWRTHAVHHSDTHFDVSSGIRFHPLEILPSFFFKLLLAITLGLSPLALLIYEALLLGCSLFSHANLHIPAPWERWLRRVIITPDWHRIHHSTDVVESNCNFGNFLSLWDRIFNTAREQPAAGHAQMSIGLQVYRDATDQRLPAMLIQPLRQAPRNTP